MTFDFALRGLLAPAVFAGVLLLLAWVSRDSAEKASRAGSGRTGRPRRAGVWVW